MAGRSRSPTLCLASPLGCVPVSSPPRCHHPPGAAELLRRRQRLGLSAASPGLGLRPLLASAVPLGAATPATLAGPLASPRGPCRHPPGLVLPEVPSWDRGRPPVLPFPGCSAVPGPLEEPPAAPSRGTGQSCPRPSCPHIWEASAPPCPEGGEEPWLGQSPGVPPDTPGAGRPSWGRGTGLQAGGAVPRAPALSPLQRDQGGSAGLGQAHPEPRGPFGALGASPRHWSQCPLPTLLPCPCVLPLQKSAWPMLGTSLLPLPSCSAGIELGEPCSSAPCPLPTLSCPSVPAVTAPRHAGSGAVRLRGLRARRAPRGASSLSTAAGGRAWTRVFCAGLAPVLPPARAAPRRGCVQPPLHPRRSLEETQPRLPPGAACPGGDSTPRRTPGGAQGLGGEEPALRQHTVLVRGARSPARRVRSLAMRDRPLRPCHLPALGPAAPRTRGRRAAPTRTASPPSCSCPDLHSPNPRRVLAFWLEPGLAQRPAAALLGSPSAGPGRSPASSGTLHIFWGGSLQGDGGGFGQAGKNP